MIGRPPPATPWQRHCLDRQLRALNWLDIRPVRAHLAGISDARMEQKRGYKSTKAAHPNSHGVGMWGEHGNSLHYRVPMDETLRVNGDGGKDSIVEGRRHDAKTCTFWREPWLKHPVNADHWPDVFDFWVADERGVRVARWGRVPAAILRASPVFQWNSKMGPQHGIPGWWIAVEVLRHRDAEPV